MLCPAHLSTQFALGADHLETPCMIKCLQFGPFIQALDHSSSSKPLALEKAHCGRDSAVVLYMPSEAVA